MAVKLDRQARGSGRGQSSAAVTSGIFRDDDLRPRLLEVELDRLTPWADQPRRYFDGEELQQLADSILRVGVLQPPLVRKLDTPGDYEIIAGERRWRAAKMAGLSSMHVLQTTGDAAEIALVENMQRQDLRPIEEAWALKSLLETHGYTHEVAARAVGRGRQWVTDTLSMLRLPDFIQQEALEQPDISANLLIQISRMGLGEQQKQAWARAKAGDLSVRAAKALRAPPARPKAPAGPVRPTSIHRQGEPTTDSEMRVAGVTSPSGSPFERHAALLSVDPPQAQESVVSTRTVGRAADLLRMRFIRGHLSDEERTILAELMTEIKAALDAG